MGQKLSLLKAEGKNSMTHQEKEIARKFYLKRMEQNRVGDEDLNTYFDNRFGKDARDCDSHGERRRIDIFRLDEKPELAFYVVVLEEKVEDENYSDTEDDFGTFYSENIHDPLESEWGSVCGDGKYVCRISPIGLDEVKEINPHLYALINEHYKDLMVVGL